MNAGKPVLSALLGRLGAAERGRNRLDWAHNKTAPRRCVNTVGPRGLADYQGVD